MKADKVRALYFSGVQIVPIRVLKQPLGTQLPLEYTMLLDFVGSDILEFYVTKRMQKRF